MSSVFEVPVPESLDPRAPGAAEFREVSELLARVQRDIWGSEDMTFSTRELWARGRLDPAVRHDFYGAVPGDHAPSAPHTPLAGAAWCFSPLADNTHLTQFRLAVAPEARRRGVGSAILGAISERALAEGRTTLMCFSEHPREAAPDDPSALVPPTGFGRIPRDDPGTQFLFAHGFTLEQSSRHSVLDLPDGGEAFAEMAARAQRMAEPRYRLATWAGPTPPGRLRQMARLMVEMSIEAPEAGLDVEAEEWTPQRVAALDKRVSESGRFVFVAAAEEVETGELVGYTLLSWIEGTPVAIQQDTLVLPGHRGHRLGWWLKSGNLLQAMELAPVLRRVHTWNAEENGHMLAINDALGFRPAGAWASWQRRL